MDIESITIICITVLVIAAIAGKCYMEHIALETKKFAPKQVCSRKTLTTCHTYPMIFGRSRLSNDLFCYWSLFSATL